MKMLTGLDLAFIGFHEFVGISLSKLGSDISKHCCYPFEDQSSRSKVAMKYVTSLGLGMPEVLGSYYVS